jgi:5S rRNA maturation endonuclease (ribonuclease M5)
MNKPSGYVDIDRLQAETTLEEAAAKCGVTLDAKGSGKEVRIDCPFGCHGDHTGRKEISINVENPQKVFMCHAYQCGFRGNLLTLMHGWLTGSRPRGGRLKGEEFQRVRGVLAGDAQSRTDRSAPPKSAEKADSPTPEPPRNIPLIDSPDARIRELDNIDAKFVVDVAAMNPAAAAYVRCHPCLSPESMKKWRCGYLPNDGGGDKRGWSLRGGIVYPVFSEDGKVLAWVGRDVRYEEKEREWSRLSPPERVGKEAPAKHRFPKGFHRGIELFGQQVSRLQEPGYREFIAEHGIIVVEGFNDVIGLDNIGIPSVGIMSNRLTEAQGERIAKRARDLADGKVTLMFDCEPSGLEGAKEALWYFAEQRLDVRLAWTPKMHRGKFAGRQPESLTREDWEWIGEGGTSVSQAVERAS